MIEIIPILIFRIESEEERIILTQIYEKYFSLMKKKISSSISQPEDCRDCIQECFMRFTTYAATLKKLEAPQLTSYILQTIRSVTLDFVQKKKLIVLDIEIDEIPDEDYSSSVELRTESKEALERFIKNFSTLPQADQVIIRALYQDHLSKEELAHKLGIQPDSIRTYISRAKKRAVALLKGENRDG